MTQGVHYRLDFITFSRLLGFDYMDRDAPRLSTIFAEGISEADLDAAEMYKPGAHPDFKTTQMKPYFYVLNNLIRYTIDPKFGDSIHHRQDAPKILARFGANGGALVSQILCGTRLLMHPWILTSTCPMLLI